MDDIDIVEQRRRRADALGAPELRAMRRAVQEAYAARAEADRSAAAHLRHAEFVRGAAPSAAGRDPYQVGLGRAAEAETYAAEAFAEWRRASTAYEAARASALDAAGCGDAQMGGATAEEQAARTEFERVRLERPPVGWGLVRYPVETDRIAAWRRLSEHERTVCALPRA